MTWSFTRWLNDADNIPNKRIEIRVLAQGYFNNNILEIQDLEAVTADLSALDNSGTDRSKPNANIMAQKRLTNLLRMELQPLLLHLFKMERERMTKT